MVPAVRRPRSRRGWGATSPGCEASRGLHFDELRRGVALVGRATSAASGRAIWEHFDVVAETPATAPSPTPGCRGAPLVPGRDAQLRGARAPAARAGAEAISSSSGGRRRATRASSPPPSSASRRAVPGGARRASACGAAIASRRTCPTSPRRSSRCWRRRASGRSGRRARRSSASRAVIDRFGQIEPKVLLAIDGYRYGDKVDRPAGRAGGDPRGPAVGRGDGRAAVPRPDAGAGAVPGVDRLGGAARASRARLALRARSPSTTRCTSSTRRGRRGCRSRSSTATAGSSWSTSRRSRSTPTSGRRTGSAGSPRPAG